jgi:hypothetical protein
LEPAPDVIVPLVMDHSYLAPAPAGGTDTRLPPWPAQTRARPEIAAAGSGLTTTPVVAAAEVHSPTVAVTLYVPAAAAVAPAICGFCWLETKAFGPVQL